MKPQRPLNISERLERGVNELTEIFKHMRDLEFTHIIDPTARDITDYTMLVDDMAATLHQLTSVLKAEELQHIHPATLAANDRPEIGHGRQTSASPVEPPANSPSSHAERGREEPRPPGR
jgi:hypothetical protein